MTHKLKVLVSSFRHSSCPYGLLITRLYALFKLFKFISLGFLESILLQGILLETKKAVFVLLKFAIAP